MTDQQQQLDPHSSSSGLGWPLVTAFGLVLAAAVAMVALGGNVADLERVMTVAFSGLGVAGGLGAWVNSTRAAKQTNGSLTPRMEAAVEAVLDRRAVGPEVRGGASGDTEWPEPIQPSIP